MNNIYITIASISTLLLLLACNNKNESLQFELLNENLQYVYRESGDINKNRQYLDGERQDAANVLNYRVTNNTKHKYLLLLNDLDFSNFYNLSLNVEQSGKEVMPVNVLVNFYVEDGCDTCVFEHSIKENMEGREKLQLLGITDNYEERTNFIKHGVVIYPGETHTFTSLVYLPLIREISPKTLQAPFYYELDPSIDYMVSLYYDINEQEINQSLGRDQLEELTKNEIKIFTGTLSTNKIPLLPVVK